MRESQRDIRKGTREIEREIMELKREEANLIREIKAAAKTGNQASLKVLAKSLVRVRTQMGKLQGSIAQLKGVSTQMTVSATCGVGGSSERACWCMWKVLVGKDARCGCTRLSNILREGQGEAGSGLGWGLMKLLMRCTLGPHVRPCMC